MHLTNHLPASLIQCGAIALFVCFLPIGSAYASNHQLTNSNDSVRVGMADLDGGTTVRVPVLCYSSGGVETLIVLPGDSTGLSEDIWIDMNDGDDYIYFNQATGYTPPTSIDCDTQPVGQPAVNTAVTWNPIQTNGNQIVVDGDLDNDTLNSPAGSIDVILYGWDGNDFLYNFSSAGEIYGEAGNDELISSTTGGNDTLSGSTGNDCLWDSSNSVISGTAFNCGDHVTQDWYYMDNASIQTNCETSAACCGLC